jgi:hypothetical protein
MSLAVIYRTAPGPECDTLTPLSEKQMNHISKLVVGIIGYYKKDKETSGFTEVAWHRPLERGYDLADFTLIYGGATAEDADIKPDLNRDAQCSAHLGWAIKELGWIKGRICVGVTLQHDAQFIIANELTEEQIVGFIQRSAEGN